MGIPRARDRIDNYPYEFSGGMRQRVMIALALSCDPSILIADEPTTALDVTIQAQILQRIHELREETEAAVILVTHDLGVVAEIADRVAVMYAGRIIEEGTLDQIFYDPQHPYTWGLLGSITRVDRAGPSGCPRSRACRPRSPTRPRAATSGRAARTSSRSASRCRRSRRASRTSPITGTAAGCPSRRSASARSEPGEIGLPRDEDEEVPAA